MSRWIVGVDVGGTNIKLGLVDLNGHIKVKTNLTTKSYTQNKNILINALLKAIQNILDIQQIKRQSILGIGVGLPGLVNPERGIINFLPNIPGWRNVPVKKIFENKLGIPTFIDNDVNVITLAEWKYGAGAGYQNMICMTLGTGIGSGLILNNELYRGEGFVAGELGHVPLNEKGPKCNCGGFACFERYVGNKYLQEKAAQMLQRKTIALEEVYDLAKQGNKRALRFWEETAVHIGNGLVAAINLLNPRLIVIGGGVANNHKFLFKTIYKTIKQRVLKVSASMVKIKKAKLGDVAGIVGAQVLVKDALKKY